MIKRRVKGLGRPFGSAFLIGIIMLPSAAQALSTYQQLSTPFYDPSGINSCSVSLDLSLTGSSAEQQAYNFFVSNGLTGTQAAGVVGNLQVESGLVPTKIQNPGSNSQNPADAGSSGWGIAQWTPGTNVQAAANDAGINSPIYELATQLEVIWAQLKGKAGGYSETKVYTDLKSTATTDDATKAFEGDTQYGGHFNGFERPQDEQASYADRLKFANEVYQQFGNAPAGTTTAVASSGGCGSTAPGQDTQFVDGFTVFSQYDPQWANNQYGDTTIAAAGCGPSAMAMIITALTGTQVTPAQTAAYADSQGMYAPGGSKWIIGPTLAQHWNLKATLVGDDISKISASLQSGSLIIVAGKGAEPFTQGGHFIVIRGVTSDGKWKVGDSAHPDANNKEWDPNQILTSIRLNGSQGSIYAISR